MSAPAPRRICRTPDEAFAAGWEDAKNHRPLSRAEIERLAPLLRLYLAPAAVPETAAKSA